MALKSLYSSRALFEVWAIMDRNSAHILDGMQHRSGEGLCSTNQCVCYLKAISSKNFRTRPQPPGVPHVQLINGVDMLFCSAIIFGSALKSGDKDARALCCQYLVWALNWWKEFGGILPRTNGSNMHNYWWELMLSISWAYLLKRVLRTGMWKFKGNSSQQDALPCRMTLLVSCWRCWFIWWICQEHWPL